VHIKLFFRTAECCTAKSLLWGALVDILFSQTLALSFKFSFDSFAEHCILTNSAEVTVCVDFFQMFAAGEFLGKLIHFFILFFVLTGSPFRRLILDLLN
jgi:hypothetical protein